MFGRSFGKRPAERRPTGTISVERLQHMFDYARRFNISSLGNSSLGYERLGRSISFHPHPRIIKLSKSPMPENRRDEILHHPPFVSWAFMPASADVGLIDGRVEYRYSMGKMLWSDMAVVDDPARLAEIDGMFDAWYRHLGLPESLQKPTRYEQADAMRAAVTGSGRMALVRHYVATRDPLFLFEVVGAEQENILLSVDWRQEEDSIVSALETILQTGELSAEFVEAGDAIDLIVTWRGATIPIRYPTGLADRDTTLVALAAMIRPDYDLRLCTASKGSDTLAFLPMTPEEWRDLERDDPEAVAALFTAVTPETALFGG